MSSLTQEQIDAGNRFIEKHKRQEKKSNNYCISNCRSFRNIRKHCSFTSIRIRKRYL